MTTSLRTPMVMKDRHPGVAVCASCLGLLEQQERCLGVGFCGAHSPRDSIAEATSPLAPALELSSSKWYLGGDHIVGHQLNTQLHHLWPRRTHCQGPKKFCSFFCTIIKQLENRSDECSIRHRTQVCVNFCRFHKAHFSAFCWESWNRSLLCAQDEEVIHSVKEVVDVINQTTAQKERGDHRLNVGVVH